MILLLLGTLTVVLLLVVFLQYNRYGQLQSDHKALLSSVEDFEQRAQDLARAHAVVEEFSRQPELPANVECVTSSSSIFEVGGDYHDVVRLEDDAIGFVVADVSGKGVAGALLATVCRVTLRGILDTDTGCSPAQALSRLNRVLSPQMRKDMFVSLVCLVLYPQQRRLVYARAGHEPVLLYSKSTKTCQYLDNSGIAVGIGKQDMFDSSVRDVSVDIEEGDVIVLYTDGITESMNTQGHDFGHDRLKNAVQECAQQPLELIMADIGKRVSAFAGGAKQHDDMTMVLVRLR